MMDQKVELSPRMVRAKDYGSARKGAPYHHVY